MLTKCQSWKGPSRTLNSVPLLPYIPLLTDQETEATREVSTAQRKGTMESGRLEFTPEKLCEQVLQLL